MQVFTYNFTKSDYICGYTAVHGRDFSAILFSFTQMNVKHPLPTVAIKI